VEAAVTDDTVLPTDAATHDDAPVSCHASMPGRTCVLECHTLGTASDGAGGLLVEPCEVYCPQDAGFAYCFDADGGMTPCEYDGDGDGGMQVFC
jgi:hypothetical protein